MFLASPAHALEMIIPFESDIFRPLFKLVLELLLTVTNFSMKHDMQHIAKVCCYL
jgi:hypothetical protein